MSKKSKKHESDGGFADGIESCMDVTDGKLPADELFRIAGRLTEVHDREGARVANELHGEIGGSLATLGIEILSLRQPVSGLAAGRQAEIQAVYEGLQRVGSLVSRLSNQLMPSILKHFGVAKAIETECREFSEQWHIPVSCSCDPIPAGLDPVLQLNYFRILQEVLDNARHHSHATRVVVSLSVCSTEIILEVSDDGVGFDVKQVRPDAGLGLITVGGRMRLIDGHYEIRSKPGQGTKIVCHAPVTPSEMKRCGHESRENAD